MLMQPDDPGDHWEDWPEGDKLDFMSWVILAAGVVAIVLMVCAWVFLDLPDLTTAARMMTERP